MDIRKVARMCLLEFGSSGGVFPLTELEYYILAEQTRKKYKMSPEEYLAGRGLDITFDIL